MADGEITLGEIARNLAAMERRQEARFSSIDSRFDRLNFVSREAFDAVKADLEAMKESFKYARRTGVAAFISLVVAMVSAMVVVVR